MKVIFFDGYCGLCNGFVDFMMGIDKKKVFKYSPLQSEFAKITLRPEDTVDLKSIVVFEDKKTTRKAQGVLCALSSLGGFWKFVLIFRIIPTKLLDWAYDFIAANRYRFFGKRDTCRLPSAEEKSRFIL